LHKCSLDIFRFVSVVAAKLSSWRCGNKLIKVLWHLKDKANNSKFQNHKNAKPNTAWRKQEKH